MQPERPSAASASVRQYFDSVGPYWEEIYERKDVDSVIYQERREIILTLADRLSSPGAEVLEVGCGAGLTAVALAEMGYRVTATDLAGSMLVRTRELAAEAGQALNVITEQCDAQRMPFPSSVFDIVVAAGVLPWVPSMSDAMREMVRVLRPGGYLIVSMDNRFRMTYVLHPFAWLRLIGLAAPDAIAFWRRRTAPPARTCSVREFDAGLEALGMHRLYGTTLGFGPFWGLNRMLPDFFNVKLHRALQLLADCHFPFLKHAGAQYITLSRRAK